ncbi:MAG: hypothetical protein KC910_05140 [Candidatus Eremiobacteraeota bacterium]|nr:hypothetical protein [Candidatus Eremiobacteraeota bacterium]
MDVLKSFLIVLLVVASAGAESLSDLNGLLTRDPHNAPALYRRASLYFRKGNLDAAILDASRSLSNRPDRPQAYLLRGHAYWKMGRLEAACQDFAWARQADPEALSPFLFYYLCKREAGEPVQDELKKFAKGRDDPALLMLLNRIPPQAYLSTVQMTETDRAHLASAEAQAHFIIGHYYRLLGREKIAKAELAGLMPVDFIWARDLRW